jgi:hypothetical protein
MLARIVTRRGLFTPLAYRFSEEEGGGDKKMEDPETLREDKKTELHRRFSGEVKSNPATMQLNKNFTE